MIMEDVIERGSAVSCLRARFGAALDLASYMYLLLQPGRMPTYTYTYTPPPPFLGALLDTCLQYALPDRNKLIISTTIRDPAKLQTAEKRKMRLRLSRGTITRAVARYGAG